MQRSISRCSVPISAGRTVIRPLAACILGLAADGLITSAARAADTFWLAPTSGLFGLPANWSAGVPGVRSAAVFGGTASTTPFTVNGIGVVTLEGLRVINQQPTLQGMAGGGSAIGLLNNLIVRGPAATPAVLTLSDVAVAGTTFETQIGNGVGAGTVKVLDGATLVLGDCLVGSAGGFGMMTVGSGGALQGALPTDQWLIGSGTGGNGTLTIQAGGLVSMQGDELHVGRNGGTGMVIVDAGATLDLDGQLCRIGSGVGTSGTGSMMVAGSIVDTPLMQLGWKIWGALTIQPGASVQVPIQIGLGGPGQLTCSGDHTLPSLHMAVDLGNGPGTGTATFTTAGSDITVQEVVMSPHVGGYSTVNVATGAKVTFNSLSIGGMNGSGSSIKVSSAGSLVVESMPLFAAGQANVVRVEHLGSLLVLPAAVVPPNRVASLEALLGGQLHGVSLTSDSVNFVDLKATGNGDILFTGAIDIEKGSLIIGEGGSSVSASSCTKNLGETRFILPLPTPGLITSGPVTLGGTFNVTLGTGQPPTSPVDIRLIHAPNVTIPPVASLPTLLGYPPLLVHDAQGLILRVIDHVDLLEVLSALSLGLAETTAVPVFVHVDGTEYPTLNGLTMTVDDPLVAKINPPGSGPMPNAWSVTGVGAGTATVTVHYGQAIATIAIDVFSRPSAVQLVSGIGITYGDDHSGSEEPGQWVVKDTLGPGSSSLDGSIVAFTTAASNLVPGDLSNWHVLVRTLDGSDFESPGMASAGDPSILGFYGAKVTPDAHSVVWAGSMQSAGNIFLRDRWAGTTETISVAGDGSIANGTSLSPFVSADGRYVLFMSSATNLVPDDTNETDDVFLRDRVAGTTKRVSLSLTGTQLAVDAAALDLSADGRYAFFTRSTAGWHVGYRYDNETSEVTLVTPGQDGTAPQTSVQAAQVSPDGMLLTYLAIGPEPLVPGPVAIGAQLYQRNLVTGETIAISRTREGDWASAPIDGFAAFGDGRLVAVATRAPNLSADANADGLRKIYRLDRSNGLATLVSTTAAGPFNADVDGGLDLTMGGTRVIFSSDASNVTPFDEGGHHDVFAIDVPVAPLGDLNGDGVVDQMDLASLLGLWGSDAVTLDGTAPVDAGDLAVLIGGWTP